MEATHRHLLRDPTFGSLAKFLYSGCEFLWRHRLWRRTSLGGRLQVPFEIPRVLREFDKLAAQVLIIVQDRVRVWFSEDRFHERLCVAVRVSSRLFGTGRAIVSVCGFAFRCHHDVCEFSREKWKAEVGDAIILA